MKKIVSIMIAGVSTFGFGASSPCLRAAARASGRPIATIKSATTGPTAPATINALRPPMLATSAAMIAGATAPPRKPAKV